MLKGEDVFNPIEVTYDSKRPVALIPGLAIHMQREANNGWKIDRQKELMPLMDLPMAGGQKMLFFIFWQKNFLWMRVKF